MEYYKDITEAGVSYFYAKQPDYPYAVMIAITPNGLVNTLRFSSLPSERVRKPSDRAEFAQAFNKAIETFTDFLKINP